LQAKLARFGYFLASIFEIAEKSAKVLLGGSMSIRKRFRKTRFPKTFIFIRHGESFENVMSKKERVGARRKTELCRLTPKGEEQARLAGEWIREHVSPTPPAAILCSSYRRAGQTARLAFPGRQIIEEPLLEELNRGVWHTKMPRRIEQLYPGETERREKEGYAYRPPDGESFQDMMARVQAFMVLLEEGHWGEGFIVAVGHSRWHLGFEHVRLDLSEEETFRCYENRAFAANASVTIYHGTEGGLVHDPNVDYVVPWALKQPTRRRTSNAGSG
jgi:probable phosphoglycerate mutase